MFSPTRVQIAFTALVCCFAIVGCDSPDSLPSASTDSAGSASSADPAQASVDPDEAVLAQVIWQDGDNGQPRLDFTWPLAVTEPTVGVISQGDGATLQLGQLVTFDTVMVSGADGSVISSTFASGQAETLMLTEQAIEPALLQALVQLSVGSRLVYAVPPEETMAIGSQSASESATTLAAIMVRGTIAPPRFAHGREVTPAEDLPVARVDSQGQLAVDIPKVAPPSDLVVEPLIEGDGPVVESADSLVVRYTGWTWAGAKVDSTWADDNPATFDSTSGSWLQWLAGQTIGSRVLLIIPPELIDNGDAPGVSLPENTEVFVVDILGAY